MKTFYLSFAGEEGFRGACLIEATSFHAALADSHRLKINPGGEVVGVELDFTDPEVAATTKKMPKNTLMTKGQMIELVGGVSRMVNPLGD